MIAAIDRGNGITELICKEEGKDEDKNVCKTDEPNCSDLPDATAGIMHRDKGTIKGCYCGRNGVTVVFNRLLCSGREDEK